MLARAKREAHSRRCAASEFSLPRASIDEVDSPLRSITDYNLLTLLVCRFSGPNIELHSCRCLATRLIAMFVKRTSRFLRLISKNIKRMSEAPGLPGSKGKPKRSGVRLVRLMKLCLTK